MKTIMSSFLTFLLNAFWQVALIAARPAFGDWLLCGGRWCVIDTSFGWRRSGCRWCCHSSRP